MDKAEGRMLNKPGMKGNFLNLINGTYQKTTAHIMLHGED